MFWIVVRTIGLNKVVLKHRLMEASSAGGTRTMVDELDPADRVVIRALPSSRYAISARLEQELRTALRRTCPRTGAPR